MSNTCLMGDIFVFADETGDLGYNLINGSKYFGFGTATITSAHSGGLWESFAIRCYLESRGIELPNGFHATGDQFETKTAVFRHIRQVAPRFDFTFLDKSKAMNSVRAGGDLYLYKLAWYLHFKYVAEQVASPNDTVYAISASIKTKSRERKMREALTEVAIQVPNRKIIPIYWNSATSWGLQMADYGLWAAQRKILNVKSPHDWWEQFIAPRTQSFFEPWR